MSPVITVWPVLVRVVAPSAPYVLATPIATGAAAFTAGKLSMYCRLDGAAKQTELYCVVIRPRNAKVKDFILIFVFGYKATLQMSDRKGSNEWLQKSDRDDFLSSWRGLALYVYGDQMHEP
jgi:hypothetical protein